MIVICRCRKARWTQNSAYCSLRPKPQVSARFALPCCLRQPCLLAPPAIGMDIAKKVSCACLITRQDAACLMGWEQCPYPLNTHAPWRCARLLVRWQSLPYHTRSGTRHGPESVRLMGRRNGAEKGVEEDTLSGSTRRSTYAEGVVPKRGSAKAPL